MILEYIKQWLFVKRYCFSLDLAGYIDKIAHNRAAFKEYCEINKISSSIIEDDEYYKTMVGVKIGEAVIVTVYYRIYVCRGGDQINVTDIEGPWFKDIENWINEMKGFGKYVKIFEESRERTKAEEAKNKAFALYGLNK